MYLIYCSAGNKRFSDIANQAGFLLGAQIPGTVYSQPFFCDQDWKRPDRVRYMAGLAEHRPAMATVLDWERQEQFHEVMDWAAEAAQYADAVLIIPKIPDTVERIPWRIGGKPVIIGYSVPTAFGGTTVPIWELEGRAVHLLGGSPHRQMREYAAISGIAHVVSADGNMAQKMAVKRCQYWVSVGFGKDGHWQKMGNRGIPDMTFEAFRRSCQNITAGWKSILPVTSNQCDPRRVAEAALRVLGHWPQGWGKKEESNA